MCAVGPKQDRAERPTEGKQPVAEAQRHCARRTTDQIGHDHYRLLGEEQHADRTMGVEVRRERHIGEIARARGADDVRRDPDDLLRAHGGQRVLDVRRTPGTTSVPAFALGGGATSGDPLPDHGIEAEAAGPEQRHDEREDG